MTPALKAARGTKRSCQNEDCNLNFYDLDRAEIRCPYCGAAFVPQTSAPRQQSVRVPFRRMARHNASEIAKTDDTSLVGDVIEPLPDIDVTTEPILDEEVQDDLDIEAENEVDMREDG